MNRLSFLKYSGISLLATLFPFKVFGGVNKETISTPTTKKIYPITIKELKKKLYDRANEIVGGGGIGTRQCLSITGEEYVEFAAHFSTPETLLQKWEEWIYSYCIFTRYRFDGKILDTIPPSKIYWRIKPEIKNRDGKYTVYARLLISYHEKAPELGDYNFVVTGEDGRKTKLSPVLLKEKHIDVFK